MVVGYRSDWLSSRGFVLEKVGAGHGLGVARREGIFQREKKCKCSDLNRPID